MIQRDDILSMEYLKKTEFTGCHQGMRYRLEQTQAPEDPEGGKKLMVTVWPEPFNYFKTPEEKKKRAYFSFDEDGVVDAVGWMTAYSRIRRYGRKHLPIGIPIKCKEIIR